MHWQEPFVTNDKMARNWLELQYFDSEQIVKTPKYIQKSFKWEDILDFIEPIRMSIEVIA